jgi:hypothetical protein
MIQRNRNDNRPIDLTDCKLVGLKPAEIKYVGGRVEVDVCIGPPIPIDLGRRHGALHDQLNSAAPPKSL